MATYETKWQGPPVELPWGRQHRFVAHRLSIGERGIRVHRVDDGYVKVISEFLSDL
jgi:hypothetical protein